MWSYLKSASDYELYLVNPTISEVEGTRVYPSLADLPVVPDLVDVFRRHEHLPGVLQDTITVGAEVLWLQRREIVLAAGVVLGYFSVPYVISVYLTSYAHTNLGYSRNLMLFVGVLTGLAQIAAVVLSAALCDRVGHRRIVLVGLAGCLAQLDALVANARPVLGHQYPAWLARSRAGDR